MIWNCTIPTLCVFFYIGLPVTFYIISIHSRGFSFNNCQLAQNIFIYSIGILLLHFQIFVISLHQKKLLINRMVMNCCK